MAASVSVEQARARASQLMIAPTERQQGIDVLLDALRQSLAPNKSQSTKNAASAADLANLQALKLLGRSPQGSEALATTSSLDTLCTYAQLKSDQAVPSSSTSPPPTPPSEARLEAWRILCNTLKLHPDRALNALQEDLPECIENAVLCLSSGPPSLQFLASRLLFLVTVKGSEIVRTLVDSMALVAHLHQVLQRYCNALDKEASPTPGLTQEETMAVAEVLKMLYNITIFYPRLQTMDPKPTSGESSTSPSSKPPSPTTTLPVRSGPTETETSSPSSALGRGIRSVLKQTSPSNASSGSSGAHPSSPSKLDAPKRLEQLDSVLVGLVILLPFRPQAPLSGSPLGGALLCLGELSATPVWFQDRAVPPQAQINQSSLPTTSTTPESDVVGTLPPLVAKLIQVLDRTTAYCFPGDLEPDDAANRAKLEREGRSVVDLDAELAPLLLIIRKCVISDERGQVGATLRGRLLSTRIDRSDRLDKRKDLTGRLLRLMASVYFSNTKVGAGELLFALCGQDSETFTATLGYGLAAGFLASNGILGAPVAPPEEDEAGSPQSQRPINPITGLYEPADRSSDPTAGMSEEEKEQEAERLFVLFERLKKTGVVDVKNPVEVAQQNGRFEELGESDTSPEEQARKQKDEDEKEQREAEEEMRRWKSRNAGRQ